MNSVMVLLCSGEGHYESSGFMATNTPAAWPYDFENANVFCVSLVASVNRRLQVHDPISTRPRDYDRSVGRYASSTQLTLMDGMGRVVEQRVISESKHSPWTEGIGRRMYVLRPTSRWPFGATASVVR